MGKLTMSITSATLVVDGKVVGSLRDFSMEGTLSTGRRVIADVVGDMTALIQRPIDFSKMGFADRKSPLLKDGKPVVRQERYCRQCASERCGHLHGSRCPVRAEHAGLDACTCAPVKEPGIREKRRDRRRARRAK